ncbi:MAG: Flagellar brake protein YcgR [Syntrophorhabdaceae bacterium PtaU1.Bin034]|jgi:hypothetical protein|nr:MAG: Flagellar brake protein YcgR [Syntrophorhabdaceae bacterium PtaU1.Bin034]
MMKNIRPGLTAKIVTEIDLVREKIRVKNSMVYDVVDDTIILAQTEPPISKSMIDKEIIITYLVKQKDEMVRYGFPAKLKELIDYNLASGQQVKALVASGKALPAPYSIRMFYRVAPTGKSGLEMYVQGQRVNVLDISLGGAKFSYPGTLRLQPDSALMVRIEIDETTYQIESMLLRTWEGDNERFRSELGFASVEFVNVSRPLEHALSRKIREIERESRFRETFP